MTTITALSTASTLDGTEVLPIDQDLATVKVTTADLATFDRGGVRCTPPQSNHRQRSAAVAGNYARSLDSLQLFPIHLIPGHTYTTMGIVVNIAESVGTGEARIGLYDVEPDGSVGGLLIDGGTVSTASTGAKDVSISFTATKALAYAAVVFQVSVTSLLVNCPNNNSGYFFGASGLAPNSTNHEAGGCLYQAAVSGALPSTVTPVMSVGWNTPAVPPCVTYA